MTKTYQSVAYIPTIIVIKLEELSDAFICKLSFHWGEYPAQFEDIFFQFYLAKLLCIAISRQWQEVDYVQGVAEPLAGVDKV